MTFNELRRAIDDAYDSYRSMLNWLLGQRWDKLTAEERNSEPASNAKLHGIAKAHELLGDVADEAYLAFLKAQSEHQNQYNAFHDAKILVKEAARQRVEERVAVIEQAKNKVHFCFAELEREKTRAAALVEFCGAGQEEHDAIVAAAQLRLDDAQEDLNEVLEAVALPEEDRYSRIHDAVSTYTGPVNKRGKPRIAQLREHAGIPDLTFSERNLAMKKLRDAE